MLRKEEINENIDKIYFSLGNKEANATNMKYVPIVKENTESIAKYFGKNIETIYEENEGDHFQNADKRMAKAIKWILD